MDIFWLKWLKAIDFVHTKTVNYKDNDKDNDKDIVLKIKE